MDTHIPKYAHTFTYIFPAYPHKFYLLFVTLYVERLLALYRTKITVNKYTYKHIFTHKHIFAYMHMQSCLYTYIYIDSQTLSYILTYSHTFKYTNTLRYIYSEQT